MRTLLVRITLAGCSVKFGVLAMRAGDDFGTCRHRHILAFNHAGQACEARFQMKAHAACSTRCYNVPAGTY